MQTNGFQGSYLRTLRCRSCTYKPWPKNERTLLRISWNELLTFLTPHAMNTDSIPPLLPGELPPTEALSGFERFRESVAESLFFLSRNFTKLLTLRSTPRAWTAFRVMLGFAGAALVVLPLSLC